MVLTEQDINEMVKQVLSELRHRIDPSMQKLAKWVIRLAKLGGGIIPAFYINKLNPYFKATRPLRVRVIKEDGDNVASFNIPNNEIIVTKVLMRDYKQYLFSSIMHELSHYVDLTRRTKQRTETISCKDKFLSRFSYLFQPTEMQARLSEYAAYLEKYDEVAMLNVSDDRTRLFITEMKKYVDILKNAVYTPTNPLKGYELVKWASMVDAGKKKMRDTGEADIKKLIDKVAIIKNDDFENEQDFEKRKASAVKLYEKRLRAFTHKALKIKYDHIAKLRQ